jgi:hypothetical protein
MYTRIINGQSSNRERKFLFLSLPKILFMEKIGFRIPLLLSVGLYVFSLFLPVYSGKEIMGWLALLGGWMTGLNDLPSAVSWFANLTYIIALILILKRKKPKPFRAFIFAILSVVLGCGVLAAGKAFAGYSEIMGKLPMGFAFYAWIGSFILMALAAWIKFKKG